MTSPPPDGAALRAAAARINQAVVTDRQDLEHALNAALGSWPERDAALLKAMAFGMLRWHHRLQWQLRSLIGEHKARRDAVVAALIRCGLFQIQFLRVPDHAAVAATVAAARHLGKSGRVGLINALLRRFLRERPAFEPQQGNPVAYYSHPAWFIEAVRGDWPAQVNTILAANNEQPPMWLRVNRRQSTPGQYLKELDAVGLAGRLAPAAGPDAVLLKQPVPVTALPGFAAGRVSVQDGAAQLACELVDLAPGLRVLDACAAPGGKTAHMLERCPGLDLVAIDRSPRRVELLTAGLARLGITARVIAGDAAEPSDWWDGQPFDRILLDAPCSATGVIRRHPDIKVLRQPDDVSRARTEQVRLLVRLWPLLAPGGRLVYATCSVLRAENQALVGEFLARTDIAEGPVRAACGERQILPGEANMDGFYYACILKRR